MPDVNTKEPQGYDFAVPTLPAQRDGIVSPHRRLVSLEASAGE